VGHSWWKEPFCAATDSTGVNIPMTSITDKAVRIDADAMAVEVDAGVRQGLTLVHFSAQLKRILWDTLGA